LGDVTDDPNWRAPSYVSPRQADEKTPISRKVTLFKERRHCAVQPVLPDVVMPGRGFHFDAHSFNGDLRLRCQIDQAQIVLEVETAVRLSLNTDSLMERLGLEKSDGIFKHVFSDLYEFSRTSGTVSLAALESDLAKTDMSETPVFEAFGIKFPDYLAGWGGTVVLMSIQIYFLIYLRDLKGRLKPDDEGWVVPWVAMDSGILARSTILVTFVVLPIASLLTLDVQMTRRMMKGYWNVWRNSEWKMEGHLASFTGWHWTVDVRLALMLVCLGISTYLAVLCWKYRPQMDERADTPEDVAVESPS
jgi:hypothetical protein